MIGTIELADGKWILKDNYGEAHLLGNNLPPEAILPITSPGETAGGNPLDAFMIPGEAEESLPYAEPGMTGIIELVDGRWVLKDQRGELHLLGNDVAQVIPESLYPNDENVTIEGSGGEFGLPESKAEESLPYAEPGMSGTIALVDGKWILKDTFGENHIIGDELAPEDIIRGETPGENGLAGIIDPRFSPNAERPEESLPYAIPGLEGVLELVDGNWVLKGDDGEDHIITTTIPPEYIAPSILPPDGQFGGLKDLGLVNGDNPEITLPYAESGMEGTIALIDGRWILKDSSGMEFLVNADQAPEYVGASGMPDDSSFGTISDSRLGAGGEIPETSLAYAEPGMYGQIELIDGKWLLKDSKNEEFIISAAPELVGIGKLPDETGINTPKDIIPGAQNAEESLPYAEPGMTGIIELVDGRWMLSGNDGEEYLIKTDNPPDYVLYGGTPPESKIALLDGMNDMDGGTQKGEVSLPYAEPGMFGKIELVDGRWVLGSGEGRNYLINALNDPELVDMLNPDAGKERIDLYDSIGVMSKDEMAETSLPFAEPGMIGFVELIDGRWIIRDNKTGQDFLVLSDTPVEESLRLEDPSASQMALKDVFASDYKDGAETLDYLLDPSSTFARPLPDPNSGIIDDYDFYAPSNLTPKNSDIFINTEPGFGDGAEISRFLPEPRMNSEPAISDPYFGSLPESVGILQSPDGSRYSVTIEPRAREIPDYSGISTAPDSFYQITTEPWHTEIPQVSNAPRTNPNIEVFVEQNENGQPEITRVQKTESGIRIEVIKEPTLPEILEVYMIEDERKQRTIYMTELGMVPSDDLYPETVGAGAVIRKEPKTDYTMPNAVATVRQPREIEDGLQPPVIKEGRGKQTAYPIIIKEAQGKAYLDGAKFVDRLETGKYYLQIGNYNKMDVLETELTKLNKQFPYAVQADGWYNPTYKLLVGPVNEGESNALLQRFQSNGYKDVFVRYPKR
jgi:hypothetical protein